MNNKQSLLDMPLQQAPDVYDPQTMDDIHPSILCRSRSATSSSDLLCIDDNTSPESSTSPFTSINIKTSNLRAEAKEFIYNPVARDAEQEALAAEEEEEEEALRINMYNNNHYHYHYNHSNHHHNHHSLYGGNMSSNHDLNPYTIYIPYTMDTHRLLFNDGSALQRSSLSQEIKNFFIRNYKISARKQSMKKETVEMIGVTLNDLREHFMIEMNKSAAEEESDAHVQKHMFFNKMKMRKDANERWNVFVFGSESWNTQSIDSDVDVAIQLPFYTNRGDKIFVLQQLIAALSLKMKNSNNIKLLRAKYPIIRMETAQYQFDISIADEYCLRRKQIITQMIDEFNALEIPIKELIVFVKYWSKQRRINSSYRRYLNSFGYTLLTINYLQFVTRNVSDKKYYDLSYLVYGFFSFYVNHYDFAQQSIQIVNCEQYYLFHSKMNENNLLEIIDPANATNNIAKNVGFNEYHRIRKELYRCYQMLNVLVAHHLFEQHRGRDRKKAKKNPSIFKKLTQSFA